MMGDVESRPDMPEPGSLPSNGMDLIQAIKSGSVVYVRQALNAGADPSQGQPLSVAVRNSNCLVSPDFVAIIEALLEKGTSPSDRAAFISLALKARNNTYYCDISDNRKRRANIDCAIPLIKSAPSNIVTIPKASVAKSTIDIWKTLLGSQDFSDVKFLFPDGSVLHAHRCVLAAASPYFERCFKGGWAENNNDGIFEVPYSMEVMKVFLTFIYSGELDPAIMKAHIGDVLSITSQYELEDLQALAEQSVLITLSLDNIKESLQLAHLHDAAQLKIGCFEFIHRNGAKVWLDTDVKSLEQENPDLWSELVTAVRRS